MAQTKVPNPIVPVGTQHLPRPLQAPDSLLGIPVQDGDPSLAPAFYQELTNKLAWALGSTYRVSYHAKKGPVRDFAWQVAKRIVAMQGLPDHHLKQN